MAHRLRATSTIVIMLGLASTQAAPVSAQSITFAPSVGRADVRTASTGAPDVARRGWIFGALGEGSFGWLRLRGSYHSGRLEGTSGGAIGTVRVHRGGAYLGPELAPGVVLGAGPWISHVPAAGGGRTILRWRVVAELSLWMIPERMSGYATLGGSLAGSDIEAPLHLGGGGGEVGLRWAPPGSWVRAALGYRLDREALALGGHQTFETASLSLGVAVPSTDRSRRRP